MAFSSRVQQISSDGSPAQPCFELSFQDNEGGPIPCFCARNFGVRDAAVVEFWANWKVNEVSSRSRAGFGVMRSANGSGVAVMVDHNGADWSLLVGTAQSWTDYGSMVASDTGIAGLAVNTWQRIYVKCTVNEDRSLKVVAQVRDIADVVLGSVTATLNMPGEDYCGAYGMFNQLGGTSFIYLDNIRVKASGSTDIQVVQTATSYVYTFVNDLGQEGPPSAPSDTVLRPDGVTVEVTMPTTTPLGTDPEYGIVGKRLYRAISGATGTVFVLIADEDELALADATFNDTLDDSEIANNDILQSDEWDLPPDDLEGIIALPNGIMAGFRKNQLCLSEANRPHAWPVRYRLPVDTDIVAIANIDNTIVIGTKSFVYTATGNTPASYSMSKPGEPQACVAKRGMVYLTDVGVVFPSPDGFMVCAGSAGQVSNLTEGIFTKRQWEALNPSSIIAAVHDGVLFFWCDGPNPDAGYALDAKQQGFGLIRLSHHATAVHVEPLTDALYLVLDDNSEPTDVLLPEAGTAPVPNGLRIYQFDAGSGEMVFRWRGKLNLMPYPTTMTIAQVRAPTYANIIFRVYGDGALVHERVLTNVREFVLPAFDTYDELVLEFTGTTTVRTAQVAEDVQELS